MSVFAAVKVFFSRIGKKVLAAVLEVLKSDAGEFIADVKPIALKAVENASKLDINGDGKREHAKVEILEELKNKGMKYKDRYLNLVLEVAVAELFPAAKDAWEEVTNKTIEEARERANGNGD